MSLLSALSRRFRAFRTSGPSAEPRFTWDKDGWGEGRGNDLEKGRKGQTDMWRHKREGTAQGGKWKDIRGGKAQEKS